MKIIFSFLLGILAFCQFGCSLEDPLADLNCDDIFSLSSDDSGNTIANGVSFITFTANLGTDVRSNVAVNFKTDYGFFEGSGKKNEFSVTSSGKKAVVRLQVTNVVTEFEVSAQVEDNCQQFLAVTTTQSLPQFFDFQTDRLSIKADRSEQAMLAVDLFRNPGAGVISEDVRVILHRHLDDPGVLADLPEFAFAKDGAVMVGYAKCN